MEELEYCVPLGIPHSRFLGWSDLDQDKALLYLREKRRVCQSCGTDPDEWARDRFAYIAGSRQCSGCELIEQEKRNIPEKAQGVHVFLRPAWAVPDDDDDEVLGRTGERSHPADTRVDLAHRPDESGGTPAKSRVDSLPSLG